MQLASGGASAELWGDLPTVSAAQYVSLLSGVTPQDSGRRNNDALRPVHLDSVPARVRSAGGTTAVMSDCVDWWPLLFPGDFDTARSEAGFDEAVALAQKPPTFTLIHLCAYDDAGHAFGATTPEYRQAGESIDRSLKLLLAAWGTAGPVLITADHGHVDAGGHGGDESVVRRSFLVARGDGVKADGSDRGRLVDLAPTLSALLGVAAPASSEGRTLTGVLGLEESERQRLEAVDRERLALLERETAPYRDELLARAQLERLMRAGLAVLIAGLLFRWLRRTFRSTALGLGSGLLALALTAVDYAALVGAVSLSAARRYGDLILTTAELGAAAAFVIIVVPAFVLLRRRGTDEALGFVAAAVLADSLLAGAMLVAFGVTAPRISIDSSTMLALPSLANAAVAAASALGLLATLMICVLGRKRSGSPPK